MSHHEDAPPAEETATGVGKRHTRPRDMIVPGQGPLPELRGRGVRMGSSAPSHRLDDRGHGGHDPLLPEPVGLADRRARDDPRGGGRRPHQDRHPSELGRRVLGFERPAEHLLLGSPVDCRLEDHGLYIAPAPHGVTASRESVRASCARARCWSTRTVPGRLWRMAPTSAASNPPRTREEDHVGLVRGQGADQGQRRLGGSSVIASASASPWASKRSSVSADAGGPAGERSFAGDRSAADGRS